MNTSNFAFFRRLLLAVVIASTATAASATTAATVTLQGLEPASYMQRRNRLPELSGELKALPTETLLAILRDDAVIAWPADSAYPPALKAVERAAWRTKERRAVQHGVMAVLARVDDPRVVEALLAATADVDVKVAAAAAERLGALPGREAVLADIARDVSRSLDVRAGACAGLGAQRSTAAVEVLVDIVAGDAAPELKLSALTAIEGAGSRWAAEARGDVEGAAALRATAARALARLALPGDVAVKRDVVVKRLRA